MTGRRLLVIAASALLLTGCTPSAQTPPPSTAASDVSSPEQRDALVDGAVSYDEYAAGFQRYTQCMEKEGYPPIVHGEENKVITYSVPSAGVDSGADERCYDREFKQLDDAWQVSQEDTGETAEVVRDCLSANGIEPATTLEKMLEQLDEAGIGMETCLATAP